MTYKDREEVKQGKRKRRIKKVGKGINVATHNREDQY